MCNIIHNNVYIIVERSLGCIKKKIETLIFKLRLITFKKTLHHSKNLSAQVCLTCRSEVWPNGKEVVFLPDQLLEPIGSIYRLY